MGSQESTADRSVLFWRGRVMNGCCADCWEEEVKSGLERSGRKRRMKMTSGRKRKSSGQERREKRT